MYAIIVRAKVPTQSPDEVRAELEREVVSGVKANPGFISAFWLAPANGEGISLRVFESESQATAAAKQIQPLPGVEVLETSVREVVASA